MKRIYQVFVFSILALISFDCQKEFSGEHHIANTDNSQSSPITATVQGNVLDEKGLPAQGVTIKAGSQTTITDARGYFRLADASLDKNAALVTATQPGYFTAFRSFRATSGVNQLVIQLTKRALAATLEAAAGGNATLTNGAKISLPANGITKGGAAYTGTVQVYAAFIDPMTKEIGKTIPGSLMADDKNKNRVALSSYGMMAVQLESPSGEHLQVADGSLATLTMPIPASLVAGAPAIIPLWYLDEQRGIWKEEGTAQKSGNSYVGQVKHFSYWNCDISLPGIAFSAVIRGADGLPLKNAAVNIRQVSGARPTDSVFTGGGYAHGYTDSLGQVGGLIPANTNLLMEVMDECYRIVFTKLIGPFSENVDLGVIDLPATVSHLVTVKGRVLACDSKPVTNGYVLLFWNNMLSNVQTDNQGMFSASFLTCSGLPQSFTIAGVDATTQQQGNFLTIPFSTPITEAGDILACGESAVQFLKYKLDGKDYTMSQGDSSVSFSTPFGGSSYNTYLGSEIRPSGRLNFNFTGDPVPGVYPINNLLVNNFIMLSSSALNVTVTAFPLQSGEYYEGNFNGSFIDSATAGAHQINCSFRLRRF